MFKFFRKYQKWMLAIGVSFLMVAFLLPLTPLSRQANQDRVVGHAAGHKFTARELRDARVDTQVLEQIAPALVELTAGTVKERQSDLRWALMLHEAGRLGLDVSDAEVGQMLGLLEQLRGDAFKGRTESPVLMGMSRIDQERAETARQILAQNAAASDRLAVALRHWGAVLQYADLVNGWSLAGSPLGAEFSPAVNRFRFAVLADRMRMVPQEMLWLIAQARQFNRYAITLLESIPQHQVLEGWVQDFSRAQIAANAFGPRISEPVAQQFLSQIGAQMTVSLVSVAMREYLDKAEPPRSEDLEKIFQQYKGFLPGQGKPHNFGYKFDNRVEVEYLEVPFDRLLAATEVSDADGLRYFGSHQSDYTKKVPTTQPATKPASPLALTTATGPATQPTTMAAAPPAPPTTQPIEYITVPQTYAEVRQEILTQLQRERAGELGDRVMATIAAKLGEAERQLPETGGYKVVPDGWPPKGWAPRSMEDVAKDVQEQFKLLPTYKHERQGELADVPTLDKIEGLGKSTRALGAGQPATLVEYVLSAKELGVKSDARLTALRLQRGVASQPMKGRDGSLYVFRLLQAQPAHVPENIELVRDQVLADARRLKAYQAMRSDPKWKELIESPAAMGEVARKANPGIIDLAAESMVSRAGPFPRRDFSGGKLEAPDVSSVGRDENFVDALFARAANLPAGSLTVLANKDHSLAVPVDRTLTLYLVRIEDYQPYTLDRYLQQAGAPDLAQAAIRALIGEAKMDDPLSLASLRKRLGYVPEGKETGGEQTEE